MVGGGGGWVGGGWVGGCAYLKTEPSNRVEEKQIKCPSPFREQAQVADFGCSKQVEESKMALSSSMANMAIACGVVPGGQKVAAGTAFWMAPEVILASAKKQYDGRLADVWSVL